MTYEEYSALCAEAAKLDEAGQTAAALAVFEGLATGPLTPIDRSLMWLNVGTLLEKLGRGDEAVAALENGARLETPLMRYQVRENQAACLHRLGRNDEALALYREMATRPWATEFDKRRFAHNIDILTGGKGLM